MLTDEDKRRILTDALIDMWLTRLRDDTDGWSHVVGEWLKYGHFGYCESTASELAKVCADEGLYAALDEAGINMWQVVTHAGFTNEEVVSTWKTYDDAWCAMCESYSAFEREELNVDILRNGSTEY